MDIEDIKLAVLEYLTKKKNDGKCMTHIRNGKKYIVEKKYYNGTHTRKCRMTKVPGFYTALNDALLILDEKIIMQRVGDIHKIRENVCGFAFDQIYEIMQLHGKKVYMGCSLIVLNDDSIRMLQLIRRLINEQAVFV